MPRNLSVEIDGKVHDVPVPDDYLHKDDLKDSFVPKDHFQTELQNRLASITKGTRKVDELYNDDGFLKEFAERKKDVLRELLAIKPPPIDDSLKIDVAKIQGEAMEKVRREELEPLKKNIDTVSQEVNDLRYRDLEAQVLMEAARLGVVPDLLDLIKIHVQQHFVWDKDRKRWFQRKDSGEEGFELSSDPKKGGAPYVMVPEYMEKLSRDAAKKGWFESRQQAGADYRGGARGGEGAAGVSGVASLDQFMKMEPAERTEFAVRFPTEFANLMNQLSRQGEQKLFRRI